MDEHAEADLETMFELTKQLVAAATDAGFVGAGVVAAAELGAVPSEVDPERVLPGYRAALVLASGPDGVVATGPTGPVMLTPDLADGMLHVRRVLEAAGWRVASAGGTMVSLPRLAAAAGLGQVSPVGALVAAGHGLRLTLFALLTDAPLVSTRPPGGDHSEHCLECRQCAYDCPAMLSGSFKLSWCTACGVCVAVCPA